MFHYFVETNDFDGLVEAVSTHPEQIHDVNFHGETPFFTACVYGNLDCANYLLKQGSDIHALNLDGQTALHKTVENGNNHMVDFLVDHKVDINSLCHKGDTPINTALRCGEDNTVLHLISKGADTTLQYNKHTILTLAIGCGRHNLAFTMLRMGVSTQSNYKMSPLVLACEHYNPLLIHRLIELGCIQNKRISSIALSVLASKRNTYTTIEYLLQQGVDPSRKPRGRTSPLAEICKNIYLSDLTVEYIALFVKFGVNVNGRGSRNETALLCATRMNNLEAVEYLLGVGANPNLKNNHGVNPLHYACREGNYPMVKLLLPYCKLSLRCRYKETYLISAAENGNIDCMMLLLKFHRFLTTDKTSFGDTAYNIAYAFSHEHACYFLKQVEEAQRTTTIDHIEHVTMCMDVWRRILPKVGKRALDISLQAYRIDSLACYYALFLNEANLLRKFRQGELVHFSTARIRELTRASGSRPIRFRIVEYLIFKRIPRDKFSMMLRKR